jgi:hypothetical protein
VSENSVKRGKTGEARKRLAKLTDDERRKIDRSLKKAVQDRDLPKFQEALSKLGLDESSAEYERLMQLWDEHWRASRHD